MMAAASMDFGRLARDREDDALRHIQPRKKFRVLRPPVPVTEWTSSQEGGTARGSNQSQSSPIPEIAVVEGDKKGQHDAQNKPAPSSCSPAAVTPQVGLWCLDKEKLRMVLREAVAQHKTMRRKLAQQTLVLQEMEKKMADNEASKSELAARVILLEQTLKQIAQSSIIALAV
jgi:hypothetical protein